MHCSCLMNSALGVGLKKKKNLKHANITNVNMNVLSKSCYNLIFFLNPTHSSYKKNKNYPLPHYLKKKKKTTHVTLKKKKKNLIGRMKRVWQA